jgi:hypothetical protein
MKAAIHFGLAVALVLAPALCCCTVRMAHAKSAAPACCAKVEVAPVAPSCCSQTPAAPPEPKRDAPKPAPETCACCAERAPAVPVSSAPTVAPAEPTGELLPLAVHISANVERIPALEGRAGSSADTKSESLFARHVLRC